MAGSRTAVIVVLGFAWALSTAASAAADRVFSSAHDEIVLSDGHRPASAYYAFRLALNDPHSKNLATTISPITIDSRARQAYLEFVTPGSPTVVLAGTLPSRPIAISSNGREFSLNLAMQLHNISTAAPAAFFEYHAEHGRITSHGLSFEESALLSIDPGVLPGEDPTGEHGTHLYHTIVMSEERHKRKRSSKPTSFHGKTQFGFPISFELDASGQFVTEYSFTARTHACTVIPGGSELTAFGATSSQDVEAPVLPGGVFYLSANETLYFLNSTAVAGETTLRFGGKITGDSLIGAYEEVNYINSGLIPSICPDKGNFTAEA